MARISQLQVTYSALEDRLLLRMSTDERSELRFWLTRRFVRALRPALTGAASAGGRGAMIADEQARGAVAEFEREAALAKADFSTPFSSEPATLPLGEAPVLLSRASVRQDAPRGIVLSLHPQTGKGVDMAIDATLAHALIRLIDQCAENADWGMDTGTVGVGVASDPDGTRRLN